VPAEASRFAIAEPADQRSPAVIEMPKLVEL
jgi:hypothetical protein